MALITACHLIAKGNPTEALRVAPLILANGLLVNHAMFGFAAWAFYASMVPGAHAQKPLVVFEVDDSFVDRCPAPLPKNPSFAFIKMRAPAGHTHVPIRVLGFVNLALVPVYSGRSLSFV